jgi:deoxyribodipyrimidine photolyase-related protein
MVLGNFALLAGIEPKAFYGWCMNAYEDACEWAAMPNAICLSQYADGGRIAAKPYVSTAGFINTMSDYCGACQYSPYEKTSENACPFNFLYWHFMAGEKTYRIKNCRLTIPHRTLEKADSGIRNAYEEKSRRFLDSARMPLNSQK